MTSNSTFNETKFIDMNKRNHLSRFFTVRTTIILLSILVLSILSAASLVSAGPEKAESPALVRIEINGRSDIEKLAAAGLSIYAQLYTPQGKLYLLASVDALQAHELRRAGYSLRVLDPDSRDASYYLLYGLPTELSQVENYISLLDVEGRQAVARLAPEDVPNVSEAGIMYTPLVLHPLVVPRAETAPSLPASITPNPLVQNMVDQVDSDKLFYFVGGLSGEWSVLVNDSPYLISTRYTYATVPIKRATRYTYEFFQSIGLPTGYDTYWLGELEKRSVIAEQAGITQPERIFLLIAHLDSTSQAPYDLAPGADDNASSSSGLMAIAEILSQYNFGCTLRYVLFTGEEQGFYGSRDYAANVHSVGDNIEAVLNLDMLGYNTPGTSPTIELHTRPDNQNDLSIANLLAESIAAYEINLNPLILQDGKSFSDHSSFWEYGYPAIMAIEDWSDHTPHYHKSSDQLETLNMLYYTEFVKAAIATFAHMGCLLQAELSGTIVDATSGNPLHGAAVQATLDDGSRWSTNTLADGTYHLTLVPGNYQVWAGAPFYLSQTSAEIAIANDQSVSQDFLLQSNPDAFAVYLPVLASEAR